jgi:hypothetical protein
MVNLRTTCSGASIHVRQKMQLTEPDKLDSTIQKRTFRPTRLIQPSFLKR